MEKKSKKTVYIQSTEKLTLNDLAYKIADIVDHDDVAYFIAKLDQAYESIEVTESLINHFEAVKLDIIKHKDPEDILNLEPKLLTSRA